MSFVGDGNPGPSGGDNAYASIFDAVIDASGLSQTQVSLRSGPG